MTSKKAKAGVMTVSGVLFLLALWEADERLNGSEGRGWVVNQFKKHNTVDRDEATQWLGRSPLAEDTKDAEEIFDAVVEEGIMKKLLRRLPHSGNR